MNKILLLLFSLVLLSSCGGGGDGCYTYYIYSTDIKFADTNEVIHVITYPDVNITDTIEAKIAKLRISGTLPSRAIVKSSNHEYAFTFMMQFSVKAASNEDPTENNYIKTYNGIEISESNAISAKVNTTTEYDYSTGSSCWGSSYLVKDHVVVE